MGNENLEVRLARLEEGMVASRGEMRAYHLDVKEALKIQNDHAKELTILRRDRLWLYGLVGVALSWLGLKRD